MIVAIDGPVGAGKTSVARETAKRLGVLHVDTGAIYRALALQCLEEDLDPKDEEAMEDLVKRARVELDPSPEGPRVFLNGTDVTEEIRSPDVTSLVSEVSAHPGVRKTVSEIQRRIGKTRSIVVEGRDTGTVVFPDAEVKIFLDADLETRVKRRARELESKGVPCSYEEVRDSIAKRDEQDRTRSTSPLKPAEDAIILDTTNLGFEEVVDEVLRIVRKRIRKRGQRKLNPD